MGEASVVGPRSAVASLFIASLAIGRANAGAGFSVHTIGWATNTGWTGGRVGVGRRMPIRVTRRLLSAALDGSLHRAVFRTDPHFGLAVPEQVPGVEPHILDPIRTWRHKGEFAETAGRLVRMFRDNFKKFEDHTDERVRAAAPTPRIALA